MMEDNINIKIKVDGIETSIHLKPTDDILHVAINYICYKVAFGFVLCSTLMNLDVGMFCCPNTPSKFWHRLVRLAHECLIIKMMLAIRR